MGDAVQMLSSEVKRAHSCSAGCYFFLKAHSDSYHLKPLGLSYTNFTNKGIINYIPFLILFGQWKEFFYH